MHPCPLPTWYLYTTEAASVPLLTDDGQPSPELSTEPARSRLACFTCLRSVLGSVPAATNSAASARRARASARGTSGYVPNEINFSLPQNRYLNRYHLLPFGLSSMYRPSPSKSLVSLGIGRDAALTVLPGKTEVSGIFLDLLGRLETSSWSRRQESNLYLPLRRRPFYPLNYGERV